MATMSLGEFERNYNINRGTVQKRAQSLGFSTSEGLSDEAVEALQEFFKVGRYAPVQPETFISTELLAVEGELMGLDTPGFDTYKLEVPSILSESYEDPMAIAQRFLAFGDQLINRLDENTAALQKRAEDTRVAAQLVADQTRRLAAKQREVEIKEAVASEFIKRDMADLQRQGRVSQ